MPLGTNNQTITTGANFIPELWGPVVIQAVREKLVMWEKCWDWFKAGKKKGDTIHVPGVSNLTANVKTAGSQVTLNSPTEGVTNLLINQHRECSFLIEDILDTQADFNLMKFYTDQAAYAISEIMDTFIIDLIPSLSQIVGSSGIDLGDADIRDAIELLDTANAPDEWRYFVIHPTQKNALFGIEKYFRADMRGDGSSKVLTKGQFGEIYGVPVSVTTQIGTSGGARMNALFQQQTWAKALQLGPRTQGDYIQEYLGHLVTTDAIYGGVEARDSFGVWVQS